MRVFAKVYKRKTYTRKHVEGRFPISFDEEA